MSQHMKPLKEISLEIFFIFGTHLFIYLYYIHYNKLRFFGFFNTKNDFIVGADRQEFLKTFVFEIIFLKKFMFPLQP